MIQNIAFRFLLLLCFVGICGHSIAQEVLNGNIRKSNISSAPNLEYLITWHGVKHTSMPNVGDYSYLSFQGAHFNFSKNKLPYKEILLELESDHIGVNVDLIDVETTVLNEEERELLLRESLSFELETYITTIKKKKYGVVRFIPFIKVGEDIQKITAFNLKVDKQKGGSQRNTRSYASTSVLNTGDWYKFGVTKTGIFTLTYADLKALGIPVSSIDPKTFKVFNNGSGMLSKVNDGSNPDDLVENGIYVEGESDGEFNQGDFILFYGQEQGKWIEEGGKFEYEKNLYADTTYYFLTHSQGVGKRIQTENSVSNTNVATTTYNEHLVHEFDNINLIKTGERWYGEHLGVVNTRDFDFQVPNIVAGSTITVDSKIMSRTLGGTSTYSINVNGNIDQQQDSPVIDNYTAIYAVPVKSSTELSATSSSVNVEISLSKGNSSAQGWVDFVLVNARRNLIFNGVSTTFRDLNTVAAGNLTQFKIAGANSSTVVWNITDPQNATRILGSLNGSSYEFGTSTNTLKEFVMFGSNFLSPQFHSKVDNQNLHALQNVNPTYIVVTNPKFVSQAKELAQFHEEQDGFTSVVVTTQQIYNEFSSGAQDITAIRSFVKMFYDTAPTGLEPKYLLLFGDGSYDYKNRVSGNSNMVPVYQSKNSENPVTSFASDDFFGLLDDGESYLNTEKIDLAIGRLPVKNEAQAQQMVDKIKMYYDNNTLNPWRNWLMFVGDDEDGGLHMSQTDQLANLAGSLNPNMNIDKILLDAYPQVSGAGGERYPQAKEAINSRINSGALILSYVGHGGELGWAKERILEVEQINKWSNSDNFPLFLTATCEFSRYDDPQRTAAGEYVLLNPTGGAIALLTTTRLVYSGENFSLMQGFFNEGFANLGAEVNTLGDLVFSTKSNSPTSENSRKFNLLGDPAVRLALPKHNVITVNAPDTLKALSRVTISGQVTNGIGALKEDFDGIVYVSIFDKEKDLSTLNNDGEGAYDFKIRNNIVFKGKASVKRGEFQFSFVVPKDILVAFGNAKISYYAENGEEDGAGSDFNPIIGGYNENAEADNEPPVVDVYMNNENFVYGGLTDESPKLVAKIFDENGINTAGTGVGHDITAILDNDSKNLLILNDYYEAELDNYQNGKIQYPFSELPSGTHTLRLKVWDVYNNSGVGETEFVVSDGANLALDHILNYPNPFTTNTAFYFEHNQPGVGLDVKIEVFTVSGKLVKSINTYSASNSYRVGPIQWNGRDDYGDLIGKGVYIYKLKVTAPNGEAVDKFEKLVILK